MLAAVPPSILQLVSDAAALRAADPSLTLRDLCSLSTMPIPSYVLLPNLSMVSEIACVHPDSHSYSLRACYHVRPDSRLIPVRDGVHTPQVVPRCMVSEVHVWVTTKLPHAQECRDYEDRNPDSVSIIRLMGGACTDTMVLFNQPGPSSYPSPAALSLHSSPGDSACDPCPLATIDVFTLYHHALSARRVIPRTLDPSASSSPASTSLVHLLNPPMPSSSPSAIRLSICRASHPNPAHGRREAHALYLTVNDARTLGNGRCTKPRSLGYRWSTDAAHPILEPLPNPAYMHCGICWRVDGLLVRESTLHVIRDCPYSQLVIDPLLRALCRACSPTHSSLTLSTASLLTTHELLTITGSNLASPSFHADIGPNIAGSISLPRPFCPRCGECCVSYVFVSLSCLLFPRASLC